MSWFAFENETEANGKVILSAILSVERALAGSASADASVQVTVVIVHPIKPQDGETGYEQENTHTREHCVARI